MQAKSGSSNCGLRQIWQQKNCRIQGTQNKAEMMTLIDICKHNLIFISNVKIRKKGACEKEDFYDETTSTN